MRQNAESAQGPEPGLWDFLRRLRRPELQQATARLEHDAGVQQTTASGQARPQLVSVVRRSLLADALEDERRIGERAADPCRDDAVGHPSVQEPKDVAR